MKAENVVLGKKVYVQVKSILNGSRVRLFDLKLGSVKDMYNNSGLELSDFDLDVNVNDAYGVEDIEDLLDVFEKNVNESIKYFGVTQGFIPKDHALYIYLPGRNLNYISVIPYTYSSAVSSLAKGEIHTYRCIDNMDRLKPIEFEIGTIPDKFHYTIESAKNELRVLLTKALK